jgi:hypothetical protein
MLAWWVVVLTASFFIFRSVESALPRRIVKRTDESRKRLPHTKDFRFCLQRKLRTRHFTAGLDSDALASLADVVEKDSTNIAIVGCLRLTLPCA